MLSKITMEELKWVGPRVMVYAGLAVLTAQAISFATTQAARWMGFGSNKN